MCLSDPFPPFYLLGQAKLIQEKPIGQVSEVFCTGLLAMAPTDVLHDDLATPSTDGGFEVEDIDLDDADPSQPSGAGELDTNTGEPKMSKKAFKRMLRDRLYEERRDERKIKRKEKRLQKRERNRQERAAKLAEAVAAGLDPVTVFKKPIKKKSTLVPVTFIIDCDFEQYMIDKEQTSLASQITRCYSDNRNATYQAHIYISSWGGKLAERFRTVFNDHQKGWYNVYTVEGDFRAAAMLAEERMKGPKGGTLIDMLQNPADGPSSLHRDESDSTPVPEPEPEPVEEYKNIVYLSSESPYVLDRLEPNTSYVIGGLVDRNREKGLCYRRARDMGIRTAKLPIGEYIVMQSRKVLATNHVTEIMLKWLEFGDWGKAFLSVIPKRKGLELKGNEDCADGGALEETAVACQNTEDHADSVNKDNSQDTESSSPLA